MLAHELMHVVQHKHSQRISRNIHDYWKTGKDNPKACLVHVHNDEHNSRQVAHLLMERCNYKLIDIQTRVSKPGRSARYLKKPLKTTAKTTAEMKKDPNEIFDTKVIDKCEKYLSEKDAKKKQEILQGIHKYHDQEKVHIYDICAFYRDLKDCSKNFTIPVVALHNNEEMNKTARDISATMPKQDIVKPREVIKELKRRTRTERKEWEGLGPRTTDIYQWALLLSKGILKKATIQDPKNPDRVIWTTHKGDYEKLRNTGGMNVVLQDPNFKGDTDLSTLFNYPDILQEGQTTKADPRYINIETEHTRGKYDKTGAVANLELVHQVLTNLGLWSCGGKSWKTLRGELP